jgi:hypothetical protein
MFAEVTRAAKRHGEMGNDEWFLIFHILHRVMNEYKHCECKKVIKSRKMWLLSDFLKMNLFFYIIFKSDTCKMNLFFYIIFKSDTCTVCVFCNFPNW